MLDLTKDDRPSSSKDSIIPPKRRLVYPRKQATNIFGTPSGIAAYSSFRKFVEQIPTTPIVITEGFNDEISISSSQSATKSRTSNSADTPNVAVVSIDRSNVDKQSPKRINVISDIIILPPTPFRSKDSKEISPESSKRGAITITKGPLSKPKIGPKSKIQQRDCPSENSCLPSTTNELHTSTSKSVIEASKNEGLVKPKRKIIPKSRMSLTVKSPSNQPLPSTSDLLHDLMDTDPSNLLSVSQQEQHQQQMVEVSEPKPKTETQTVPVIIPPGNEGGPQHEDVPQPVNSHLASTQELLQDLLYTNPSSDQQTAHSYDTFERRTQYDEQPKSQVGVKTLSESLIETKLAVRQTSTSTMKHAQCAVSQDESHVHVAEILVTDLPCQLCLAINQTNSVSSNCIEENDLIVDETIANPVNEASAHCNESTEIENNLKQSLEAKFEHIRELMSKYVKEVDRNALSFKHFWNEHVKSECDTDSSAVETQLNSNDIVDDVENNSPNQLLEQQSQAVLNPDQLEEQPLDLLNVRVKVEKMSDEGNNSISSDVEILEIRPDDPIEILHNSTQELLENLLFEKDETAAIGPFAIPQQPIENCGIAKPSAASSSKR